MMNEFQIFPDIKLVYGDMPITAGNGELMISCCTSGICECKTGDDYFYLTDENLIILDNYRNCKISCSSDHCSISLLIDQQFASADVSGLFEITGVVGNINNRSHCMFLSDPDLISVISYIYQGLISNDIPTIRIKVIEFLMLIQKKENACTKHIEKLRNIGQFICQNITEHFSISHLSDIFGMNQTTLKGEFKKYFGCSVYSYAKCRKMFCAAELLLQTDMKIIDIAEEVGYCNASKFASAFQSVIGVSPRNFRMEHNKSIQGANTCVTVSAAY
ncbi:MAG: helix-turn-helix transcriptional regulator [Ruminococcus sp.]|nr:helix-turn-helix transcriptional regulator [Ruminococcus sp.]